jgi:hypothetical protein
VRVSTCEQSACAMVTGPGRGRHLEQPDWVAGTQDVSSTETPHPAGDDLRILRQRSSPSHGRDHGTGRGRAPQSTSLPARTRVRRSVETTVPRERAFVVVPDSILQGTMPGCPASTSGVGRNSTARPWSARRRTCPMSRCGRRGEVIECDGTSGGGRSHASRCWGAKGCGAQARRALLTPPMASA